MAPAKRHTVILLDTRPAHNFVGGDPRLPAAALIRARPTFFCELLRSVTILSRRARLARAHLDYLLLAHARLPLQLSEHTHTRSSYLNLIH